MPDCLQLSKIKRGVFNNLNSISKEIAGFGRRKERKIQDEDEDSRPQSSKEAKRG